MKKQLIEQARSVVKTARSKGAKGARATVIRRRSISAEWRNAKPEFVRESTQSSLKIEVFINGRYSSNITSDLSQRALQRFVEQAVETTRLLGRDPARALPDPEQYQGKTAADLGIFDPRGAQIDIDRCRERAAALEEATRAAPCDAKIIATFGSFSASTAELAMASSNGMEAGERSTYYVAGADVSLEDGGGRTQPGWCYAKTRRLSDISSYESLGREAMQRAVMHLGSRPEKTGEYPLVIENRVATRMAGLFMRPLSGRLVQQERSFLADKIGKSIASPLLTISDQPHLKAGLRSSAFDKEGMATRPMTILDAGVLKNFYLDTYYADKLGLEPTTGRRSNVVFQKGERNLAGLLKQMGEGILINGFLGGNSNPATGDFSIGIRGQWVSSGKAVRPVSAMNLSGNHLSFWKKLAGLGDEPFPYSGVRAPSMRFGPAWFSGE